MSAEANIRGLKRICTACSARFYDMNKRPIICPSCGEKFTGEVKIKSRKAKSSIIKDDVANAIKAKAMEDTIDDSSAEDNADIQIISLDDESLEPNDIKDSEEEFTDLDLDTGMDDLDDINDDDLSSEEGI